MLWNVNYRMYIKCKEVVSRFDIQSIYASLVETSTAEFITISSKSMFGHAPQLLVGATDDASPAMKPRAIFLFRTTSDALEISHAIEHENHSSMFISHFFLWCFDAYFTPCLNRQLSILVNGSYLFIHKDRLNM